MGWGLATASEGFHSPQRGQATFDEEKQLTGPVSNRMHIWQSVFQTLALMSQHLCRKNRDNTRKISGKTIAVHGLFHLCLSHKNQPAGGFWAVLSLSAKLALVLPAPVFNTCLSYNAPIPKENDSDVHHIKKLAPFKEQGVRCVYACCQLFVHRTFKGCSLPCREL